MPKISFIDAKTSQAIDDKLMSQPGFSTDQLMELAGLSVATAAHDYYTEYYGKVNLQSSRKLLVFCGPGNNGGDGLIAARHLKHFGYLPSIIYPKQGKTQIFTNLVKECTDLEIEIRASVPTVEEMNEVNLIVDGLFGFSFSGAIRAPYDSIIQGFAKTKTPILSIDIPSGWDVNDGDVSATGFTPQATISLTLPKNCMKNYPNVHYLGGRFMPPSLLKEFGDLVIPDYGYGPNLIIRLDKEADVSISKDNELSVASAPAEGEAVVMYTSAPTLEEAKNIANNLVSSKLAACVNIIPQITSVYEWQGKIENSDEFLLMIKTRKSLAPSVTAKIRKVHSYDLPESIVVNIQKEGSNPAFVKWIVDSTTASTTEKTAEKEEK